MQKFNGIVLHHTSGYLKGDLATLVKTGNHVNVAYLASREGTIFHLFDETKNWGYHLGPGCVGGNTVLSKATIAIEMSNIGALYLQGSDLMTGYGDKYCGLDETQFYSKLPTPFRGTQYYATYTQEQVNAVAILVKHLCSTYGIPQQMIPNGKMYETFASDAEALAWRGISSHVNYRPTGKNDVGPVFPWDKLL